MNGCDWIERLRNDAALNEALGLTWAETPQQDTLREQWIATWDQVPYDEAFHAWCRGRIARSTPVALGLARRRRLSMQESSLALLFDPEQPDVPWVSLSIAMPPALWLPGAVEPKALLQRLAPYVQGERQSLRSLPSRRRLFKPLDLDDRGRVLAAIEAYELWMDDATWENAHDDDPWVGVPAEQSTFALHGLRAHAAEQTARRFGSTGMRTLWSNSALVIEQLPFGGWVFDVRYTPVDESRAMQVLEDASGISLPKDMPLDLVSSLLRGPTALPDTLREHATVELDALIGMVSIEPGEPTSYALVQRWMLEHCEDVTLLRDLAGLASRHELEGLMFDLALSRSPGDELREELESFLRAQVLGGEA